MNFFLMKALGFARLCRKVFYSFLLMILLSFNTTLWASNDLLSADQLLDNAAERQQEENSEPTEELQLETASGRIIGSEFFIDQRLLDYQLLTYIFGTMGEPLICTHENCNTLAGELFRVLNIGISTIGVTLLAYIIAMSAFNSGGQDMLSQQFSSNVIALRSVIGITFLMPNQYGYSILQQFVMSIALLGSSFANVLWHNFQDFYDLTGGLFSAKVVQSDNGEVTFETAQNAANVVVSTMARMAAAESYMNNVSSSNNTKKTVMAVKSGDGYPRDSFFSSTVESSSIDLEYQNKDSYRNKIIFKGPDKDQNVSISLTQYANIKSLLSNYFVEATYSSAASADTQIWINGITGDALKLIRDRLTLQFIKRPTLQETDFQSKIIDHEYQSWITLPDDFFNMLKGRSKLDNQRPANNAFSIDSDYQVGGFYSTVPVRDLAELDAIDKKITKEIKPYVPVENIFRYQLFVDQDTVDDGDPLVKAFNKDFKVDVFDKLNQQNQQPLMIFLEYGLIRLEGMFNILISIFFLQIIPIGVLGLMSFFQSSGKAYLTFNAIFTLLISILMLVIVDIPIIITMVFLIPLIPIVIYFSSVLAWFIQVVSSIIAAPIVALGFISPGQGLGRASPALVLLINLF